MSDNIKTILIIEDNALNLDMARDLLQRAGFQTLEAEEASQGIHLAHEKKPDLILMDMHLPIMNGYDASLILKTDPETQAIPIVGFTALAMEEDQQKALAHGCIGIISKPIDVDRFSEMVAAYLPPGGEETQNRIELWIPATKNNLIGHVEETQKIQQDLEEFLFNVSHDLQAPLRKLQFFQEFLSKAPGDSTIDDNREIIDGIARNTQQMKTLLQALLTLSRINRTDAPFREVNLKEIVSNVINIYQETIKETDAKITVGTLPTVEGDFKQLEMLFEALIDNSLKFKSEQAPLIRIQSKLQSHFCKITIEDNGLGFNEAHSDIIFKPLQRLYGVGTFLGTGMGLAIAKKIADRHHGALQVESQPGQGSRFILILPLKQNRIAKESSESDH